MLLAAVSNIHNQPRVVGGANQGWNINGPYWGDRPNIPTKIFYLILSFDISQVSQKNLKENKSLKMAAEASARISTAGAPCSLGLDIHHHCCAGQGKGKGEVDTFSWYSLHRAHCAHCVHCRTAHSRLSLSVGYSEWGNTLCRWMALHWNWKRAHCVANVQCYKKGHISRSPIYSMHILSCALVQW